jgi:hypothetical protein
MGMVVPMSAQESILVDACASLLEMELAAVLVYPNPAETHFNIDGVPTIQLVELVDLSGRVIRSFKQNIGSYDVTAVPNGSYLLRISTNGGVISAPIYIH